jgi:CDP-glucose 4,6-dehydratase
MGKTFVVTGATGFIGGHLARSLAAEQTDDGCGRHRVIVLARDGEDPKCASHVVRGRLEDLQTCERLINEFQPDGIFHLAAQPIVGIAKRDPFNTMEANVRGTYNLLEAFRRYRKPGSKMVVASSDKAYGELTLDHDAYLEDMPLQGSGPYDVSKSCADLIAQSYGNTYGLPIAIIRAGNVFGPGDEDRSRIIPSMIDDVLSRRPITIMSDGTPVREYLYVQDVVDGYMGAYVHHTLNGTRAYNLGTGRAYTVLQLAETFVDVLRRFANEKYSIGVFPILCAYDVEDYLKMFDGTHPIIEVKGIRAGEIQRQILDATRARRELHWEPHRSQNLGHRLLETFVDGWKRWKEIQLGRCSNLGQQ